MTYENSGVEMRGGVGDGGGWHGYMWVFALVIIFLALVFLWGRRDNEGHRGNYGMDGIAPLLAAQCANGYGGKVQGFSIEEKIWDNERDMMREFAQTRTEAKDTAWAMQRENDRYFYEGQKTNLLGFKDVEIEGMKNTARIESRIDQLERTFKEDTIRQQDNKINTLETIIGIRGLGLVPAYNPPYNPHFAGCGHHG